MKITILRYGHRKKRDKRVTTHCALVGRAFFANEMVILGEKDKTIEKNITDVNKRFGGDFKVVFRELKEWKDEIRKKKEEGYKIIHLTMYGIPLKEKIEEIKKEEKLAIFIGSVKVPGEVYQLSDYNISIGNQPHSEIAALAIMLYELNKEKIYSGEFSNGKVKIIPQEKGKKIIKISKD